HLNGNEWHVRHGRRILQERAWTARQKGDVRQMVGRAGVALQEIVSDNSDDKLRLRAIWSQHVIGGMDEMCCTLAMKDPSRHVRAWAVQLAAEEIGLGQIKDIGNELQGKL